MSNEFLHSAVAKIKRSETQIDDLNSRVRAFFDASPYEITSKLDANLKQEIWRFRFSRAIEDDFPVIVGEIIHNVRSSLDNLMCAVAFAHSGSTAGTYFPFSKVGAQGLENEIASKCKKLPPLAKDMIRVLQPYNGGNQILWLLHELNRTDKHVKLAPLAKDMIRVLQPYNGGNQILWLLHELNRTDKHVKLAPINLATSANVVKYLVVHSGLVLVVGARSGKHLYTEEYIGTKPMPTDAEISGMTGPTGVYTCLPGTSIRFDTDTCAADESFEFLITTPGAKFETDMKPTFNIALQDVGRAETEPVVALLSQMREASARIIIEFRRTFFP